MENKDDQYCKYTQRTRVERNNKTLAGKDRQVGRDHNDLI